MARKPTCLSRDSEWVGWEQSMVFQTYSARLVRSTPLTDLTKHLDFEIQGVPRFGFVPGQWLSVKHILPDGEELTRAYSIASPPSENGRVAFCVNRVRSDRRDENGTCRVLGSC